MRRYDKVFIICFFIFFLCISVSFAQQEPPYKKGESIKHFRETVIQLVKSSTVNVPLIGTGIGTPNISVEVDP